ncbi:MAG: ubiquinone/menaquinone biosynthesis methyltransferase [Candidatus Aminicenantes bacterium]|nr:MAG: ubiquinone/menaquinone biosynthesis methyltransferase [Candidatus Aminicenantes bacterium]
MMRKGVQKIFSEVYETYELTNHVLTFGFDILWRRKAAREAARAGGYYWLDVCSGTGEMAQNLSRLSDGKVKIVSVDFCYPMLAKALEKKHIPNVNFTLAEASVLPFYDETIDLITISFATRNISTREEILRDHLEEFHRVLKPGGHFVNLETSQPPSKLIRKLFHLYIKMTVKPFGSLLSGYKPGYSYLAFTIPRFYTAEEFSSLLYRAGFTRVTYKYLLFGMSAIHKAVK